VYNISTVKVREILKMNDKIYLLSKEGYEKYKNVIPPLNCEWWLRSPCYYSDCTSTVDCDGSVGDDGAYYYDPFVAVRPVIRIPYNNLIGTRIVMYSFPWIVIDNELAIAEMPITFMEFGEDEYYETSHVRKFLLDWIKDR
jgi:hypothetical protein